jgi:hypothetical protein
MRTAWHSCSSPDLWRPRGGRTFDHRPGRRGRFHRATNEGDGRRNVQTVVVQGARLFDSHNLYYGTKTCGEEREESMRVIVIERLQLGPAPIRHD